MERALLLEKFLDRTIGEGVLLLRVGDDAARVYGQPLPGAPRIEAHLANSGVARAIAKNPALRAGEAWMSGELQIADDDILGLLRLVGHNMRWDWSNTRRVALWKSTRWLAALLPRNDGTRAKANVAHHYDLSDRLYDLFLDADRQYSCAYFTDPGNSLETAQQDKLAHIAAKLRLQRGQRVLDIGCGWGGLALYLNRVADVDVLGITLSEEQLLVARQRAGAEGVADRVKFELIDYRNLTGQFDRIVSVGMFEHVGRKSYPAFFETIRERMTDSGIALVHSIVRADGPGTTDPFTARYIFPGGYCPALSEVLPVIEKSWLWVTDIEILRLHYAMTLAHWYKRVLAQKRAIVALYDERFYRMWTFYLASALIAFEHDGHCNAQIQLARTRNAVPLTRDYMFESEVRYRQRGIANRPTPGSA